MELVCDESDPKTPVGHIVYWIVHDELHILNVAVHPSARRRGLARAMLARLMQTCQEQNLQYVALEVRVSNEPALALYARYPVTRASWRRKLTRDASGNSGWKNLKGLLMALRSPTARPVALRILGVQAVLLVGFTLVGRPELYLLLWLAPWMTVWRVLNRLRAIAEHGGMIQSKDRRETTHHVRQSWLPRFWIVPFNTGWHLAHHVDMGVPFQHLPQLHDELVAAGWIVPDLEYPDYRTLWKALAARERTEA